MFWWEVEWIEQIERYYLLRAPNLVITPPPIDVLKKEYLQEYRWWDIDELDAAPEADTFAPRRLPELLRPLVHGHVPKEPIAVGV